MKRYNQRVQVLQTSAVRNDLMKPEFYQMRYDRFFVLHHMVWEQEYNLNGSAPGSATPPTAMTRSVRKGKLSNFGIKFQIANRMLISKNRGFARVILFSREHLPNTEANLKSAQIRFSSRMAIRYRPVSFLPVVVEINFAYTTYSIQNR